jgi:formate hydrogenlyase subunit 6/NADH:ubiquinone oxidoreductase subunit I
MAELSRPPFDMPIGDSELVFGYMTEYTGIKFAMYLLTEYAGMITMSALMVVLYLGGWQMLPGVPLPGCEGAGGLFDCGGSARGRRGVTIGKIMALVFVMVWARVAYPRLREDQLQRMAWLVLVPSRCSTWPSSRSPRWCSRWPRPRPRRRAAQGTRRHDQAPVPASGDADVPHERNDLAPRTRGVIALMDENCTVCMLCARECPDWCIYIDSHKETVPPAKEGGRARTRNVLDRFAIDFSLCMYCGICVEVCPFDALWWSPEFEYAEYDDDGKLLHEMDKLREWADTVPPPPRSTRARSPPPR